MAVRAGIARFYLSANGKARLWVDDVLVVDAWAPHANPVGGPEVELAAGRHRARLDYVPEGTPLLGLSWGPPGLAPPAPVPAANVFPRRGAVVRTTTYESPGVLVGGATATVVDRSLSHDSEDPTRLLSKTTVDPMGEASEPGLGTIEARVDLLGRLVPYTDVWGNLTSYSYDQAGREFSATAACGPAQAAGLNTNRTRAVDNGGATDYCYGTDDRLLSSSPATVALAYDSRGNAVGLDGQELVFDGADRHVATNVGGAARVTYSRDATGRIVRRAEAGQPASRHGYSGPGDAPTFVTDDAGAVARRYVALLGGVSVTVTGQHQRWSYPNVHGDVMATADASGAREGPTVVYTPDGHALGPVPDNLDGSFGYGWLGSHQRPTEHADGLAPVVQMGARPYLPSIGRFLAQGPVDGGSANAYDYLSGDPVNGLDLTGMAEQLGPSPATCIDLQPYVEEIVMSTECKVMREARFREMRTPGSRSTTTPRSRTPRGLRAQLRASDRGLMSRCMPALRSVSVVEHKGELHNGVSVAAVWERQQMYCIRANQHRFVTAFNLAPALVGLLGVPEARGYQVMLQVDFRSEAR